MNWERRARHSVSRDAGRLMRRQSSRKISKGLSDFLGGRSRPKAV